MGPGQYRVPKILVEQLLETFEGEELEPADRACIEPDSNGQHPAVVTVSVGEIRGEKIYLGHYQFPNSFKAGDFSKELIKYKEDILRSSAGSDLGELKVQPWHPEKYNKKYHSDE